MVIANIARATTTITLPRSSLTGVPGAFVMKNNS
jgi:hypothetical protein